jgi:hypothetical protein
MFRTRVIQDGVHPSLHIEYKNFDLKQYFKEGRGCRLMVAEVGTVRDFPRSPAAFATNQRAVYWQSPEGINFWASPA